MVQQETGREKYVEIDMSAKKEMKMPQQEIDLENYADTYVEVKVQNKTYIFPVVSAVYMSENY